MGIVITGASGHFGRLAVERLLERVAPQDLILVTRRPERLAAFAARGCDVRVGDFDDPAGLVEAYRGGERMLLISGTRVGKRIAQHGAAIEAAKAAGVRHIAYTSFIGATPQNPAEVVVDHRGTEALLVASGLAWTALRDSQYADAAVDGIAPPAIRSGRLLSACGEGRIAFVWREDCVDCAVAVLTGEGHENRVYEITGPQLWSFPELAELISQVSGKPVRFEATDEAGLYAFWDSLGVPRQPVDDQVVDGIPWNSDDMVSFETAVREGHFAILTDDVERLTGRRPRPLRALFEARFSVPA
jgi:NAD(P)H dehydrogenase (quinone)